MVCYFRKMLKMDQKDLTMSKAERRQHHILSFSRQAKKTKQKKKQKHCKIPQNVPPNKGNISRFLPLKVQSQITYSFK